MKRPPKLRKVLKRNKIDFCPSQCKFSGRLWDLCYWVRGEQSSVCSLNHHPYSTSLHTKEFWTESQGCEFSPLIMPFSSCIPLVQPKATEEASSQLVAWEGSVREITLKLLMYPMHPFEQDRPFGVTLNHEWKIIIWFWYVFCLCVVGKITLGWAGIIYRHFWLTRQWGR